MKCTRVLAVLSVAFLYATALPVASRTAELSSVPSPTVTGPIPITATPGDPSHDYPFFSTALDLASRGYIEEEYFFEGTASRFNIPVPLTDANTPLTTATVTQTGVPYRTRMIVRRPMSALKFDGTVVMEWQNVAFGFDVDGLWAASSEHITRRGHAWIGVSVMRMGVHGPKGLRAFSPARYGTLDVPGSTLVDDSLAYDIFSQATQAVRNPQTVDPMGGLPTRTIVAAGISQGAARLVAYQNAVHPLAGLVDGFMAIEQGGFVRPDSEARTFKILAEGDVARDQLAFRQANTDRFRRWEIAGAAHIPFNAAQVMAALMMRDLAYPLPTNCTSPPFSRIPSQFVINASLDAMVDWVNEGVEPPIAPDIEIASIGLPGFFTAELARDGFGNALGGIRLAEHAVATATNTGLNGPVTSPCRTYGSYQPFDQATLDALYPDNGTYVSRVARVTQGNVEVRFIVREDAMVTIGTASHSTIGNPLGYAGRR